MEHNTVYKYSIMSRLYDVSLYRNAALANGLVIGESLEGDA